MNAFYLPIAKVSFHGFLMMNRFFGGLPILVWCCIPGKCFHNLLARPVSRRVRGRIEMDHPPASVAEDHQDEENPESGGGDCKEIDGDHIGHVIFQEAPPGLGRWFGTAWRLVIRAYSYRICPQKCNFV